MSDAARTAPSKAELRELSLRMRSAARLYAVQALYQMELTGRTLDAVRAEFEDHRFGERFEDHEMEEGDVDHFRALLEGAVNDQAAIDQSTDRALVDPLAARPRGPRRCARSSARPAPSCG